MTTERWRINLWQSLAQAINIRVRGRHERRFREGVGRGRRHNKEEKNYAIIF